MIELLGRQEMLQLNDTLAAFIIEMQEVKYNPYAEGNAYEGGEMYDEDNDRYYSQEECDQMNRERNEEYLRKKDNIKPVSSQGKYKGQIIYKLPDTSIGKYVKSLSGAMDALTTELHWQSVLFMLEYAQPWLSQANDYEPVNKALQYLKSIGVKDDFTGGFKANGHDLQKLVKHLFWIIRGNASLPSCWFSGIGNKFVGDICKHGNFHFYLYANKQKSIIQTKALELGFIPLKECYEHLSASKKGAIKGRRLGW